MKFHQGPFKENQTFALKLFLRKESSEDEVAEEVAEEITSMK